MEINTEQRVRSPIRKFEQLIAWQKARELARNVYVATRGISFSRDRRLASQIQAAAVSVMSNIAEGFEHETTAEFHRFLVMAKASCAEVRSQLYISHDVGHLQRTDFERLMECAEEVGRVVGGLKVAVKAARDK